MGDKAPTPSSLDALEARSEQIDSVADETTQQTLVTDGGFEDRPSDEEIRDLRQNIIENVQGTVDRDGDRYDRRDSIQEKPYGWVPEDQRRGNVAAPEQQATDQEVYGPTEGETITGVDESREVVERTSAPQNRAGAGSHPTAWQARTYGQSDASDWTGGSRANPDKIDLEGDRVSYDKSEYPEVAVQPPKTASGEHEMLPSRSRKSGTTQIIGEFVDQSGPGQIELGEDLAQNMAESDSQGLSGAANDSAIRDGFDEPPSTLMDTPNGPEQVTDNVEPEGTEQTEAQQFGVGEEEQLASRPTPGDYETLDEMEASERWWQLQEGEDVNAIVQTAEGDEYNLEEMGLKQVKARFENADTISGRRERALEQAKQRAENGDIPRETEVRQVSATDADGARGERDAREEVRRQIDATIPPVVGDRAAANEVYTNAKLRYRRQKFDEKSFGARNVELNGGGKTAYGDDADPDDLQGLGTSTAFNMMVDNGLEGSNAGRFAEEFAADRIQGEEFGDGGAQELTREERIEQTAENINQWVSSNEREVAESLVTIAENRETFESRVDQATNYLFGDLDSEFVNELSDLHEKAEQTVGEWGERNVEEWEARTEMIDEIRKRGEGGRNPHEPAEAHVQMLESLEEIDRKDLREEFREEIRGMVREDGVKPGTAANALRVEVIAERGDHIRKDSWTIGDSQFPRERSVSDLEPIHDSDDNHIEFAQATLTDMVVVDMRDGDSIQSDKVVQQVTIAPEDKVDGGEVEEATTLTVFGDSVQFEEGSDYDKVETFRPNPFDDLGEQEGISQDDLPLTPGDKVSIEGAQVSEYNHTDDNYDKDSPKHGNHSVATRPETDVTIEKGGEDSREKVGAQWVDAQYDGDAPDKVLMNTDAMPEYSPNEYDVSRGSAFSGATVEEKRVGSASDVTQGDSNWANDVGGPRPTGRESVSKAAQQAATRDDGVLTLKQDPHANTITELGPDDDAPGQGSPYHKDTYGTNDIKNGDMANFSEEDQN
jgi:hypothetical protein